MTQVVEPTIDVTDRPMMDWDESATRRRERRKRPPAHLHIDRAVEGPESVIRALEQVRRYCVDARMEKAKSATRWRWWSRGLSLPATALAAFAGVTGLTVDDFQTGAAYAALVAAALGAVVTSLTPDRKAEDRRVEALRLAAIERNIAVMLYVDRDALNRERTRQVLELVMGQLDEMNGIPASPSFLYGVPAEPTRARRNGFRSTIDDEDMSSSHDVRL